MPQTFAAIAPRTNGPEIEAGHMNILRDAGIALEDQVTSLTAKAGVWTKYTVGYAALQTAALTNTVELLSLPAKGVLEAIIMKHSTAFAGTSITDVKLSVGTVSEADRFLESFDVDSAVADGNFAESVMAELLSFSGATSVKLKATAVGANLSALSAGSVDIWVKTSTLP